MMNRRLAGWSACGLLLGALALAVAWSGCGSATPAGMQGGVANGPDADNDGLSDADEAINLTNPNNPDSDGDGCPDGADNAPRDPLYCTGPLPPLPDGNSNSTDNANEDDGGGNANDNSSPSTCPQVDAPTVEGDAGDGPVNIAVAFGSALGSASARVQGQQVDLQPFQSVTISLGSCPDTITVTDLTFSDGINPEQSFPNFIQTFTHGVHYPCGQDLLVTLTTPCGVALSFE